MLVWDLASGSLLARVNVGRERGPVYSLRVTPDERCVLLGLSDGQFALLDARSLRRREIVPAALGQQGCVRGTSSSLLLCVTVFIPVSACAAVQLDGAVHRDNLCARRARRIRLQLQVRVSPLCY